MLGHGGGSACVCLYCVWDVTCYTLMTHTGKVRGTTDGGEGGSDVTIPGPAPEELGGP